MPLEKIGFIWKTLLPVAILMTTLWVFFYPQGPSLVTLWFVEITALSIAQGLVLGLRILSMAFAVFIWLYTTDQPSLIHSLVKLKVPYEWGLVLALALRYIPTFQGTFLTISEAQQARGLDISQSKGFTRIRNMMPVFVAMVISSLRAGDQLAKALEARGFGAKGVSRTVLYDIRFSALDYFYIFTIFSTVGVALFLRFQYGFGVHALRFFG
jgi:energy-coupling factor transport system permease protein